MQSPCSPSPASSSSSFSASSAPDFDLPLCYAGEQLIAVYPATKFFLEAPDPHPCSWACLATFYCVGTVYITTYRVIALALAPPSLPSSQSSSSSSSSSPSSSSSMSRDMMSLPLPWFRRDRIRVRRPFFDAHHVSALVVPNGFPYPAARPLRYDSMTLRVECLDTSLNSAFYASLMDALNDPDLVAANARALRKVLLAQLVPTDVHYALVDPDNPAVLHLATQMAFPPSSTFAQRQQHTTYIDDHKNNTAAPAPVLQASGDNQDENCIIDNSDENRNNSGDENDSDGDIQSTSSSSGSSSVNMQRQQEHEEELAKMLTSHRNGQEPTQLHPQSQPRLERQTQTQPTQLQ